MLDARKDVIVFFEKETFPYKGNVFKIKKDKSEEESEEKIKDNYEKFIKYIENESKDINCVLFEDPFNFVAPTVLTKKLYEIKNKKEKDKSVNVIKSGLVDLKNKIKEMSEDEKKIKKPDKIFKIAEEILEFNEQNQSGESLKILTQTKCLVDYQFF